MRRLQGVWQLGRIVFFTIVGWLVLYGTVLAQPLQKEAPKSGTYVLSYALVILAIALGMMAVLRPSRRRERAKAEVYDEIKMKPKE